MVLLAVFNAVNAAAADESRKSVPPTPLVTLPFAALVVAAVVASPDAVVAAVLMLARLAAAAVVLIAAMPAMVVAIACAAVLEVADAAAAVAAVVPAAVDRAELMLLIEFWAANALAASSWACRPKSLMFSVPPDVGLATVKLVPFVVLVVVLVWMSYTNAP